MAAVGTRRAVKQVKLNDLKPYQVQMNGMRIHGAVIDISYLNSVQGRIPGDPNADRSSQEPLEFVLAKDDDPVLYAPWEGNL